MNSYDRIYSLLMEGQRRIGGRIESKQARKARQRKPEDTSTATLSRDPKAFGATIKGKPKSKKRKIGVKKLKGFEPDEKMESSEARKTIDKYKRKILAGKKVHRIVTHGKTVLDGHHRLQAYKELGTKNVRTVSAGRTIDKGKK